jgi:hypothetical protein
MGDSEGVMKLPSAKGHRRPNMKRIIPMNTTIAIMNPMTLNTIALE